MLLPANSGKVLGPGQNEVTLTISTPDDPSDPDQPPTPLSECQLQADDCMSLMQASLLHCNNEMTGYATHMWSAMEPTPTCWDRNPQLIKDCSVLIKSCKFGGPHAKIPSTSL